MYTVSSELTSQVDVRRKHASSNVYFLNLQTEDKQKQCNFQILQNMKQF